MEALTGLLGNAKAAIEAAAANMQAAKDLHRQIELFGKYCSHIYTLIYICSRINSYLIDAFMQRWP